MSIWTLLILAAIQGTAELLPISSSAHVIVAEKLLGLDPSSPQMTFVLVMLHTGTMFAVIFYFWKQWAAWIKQSTPRQIVLTLAGATLATGLVGYPLKIVIEHILGRGGSKAEIEVLFSNLKLIALALGSVGLLIIYAGGCDQKLTANQRSIQIKDALWIGAVQGVCLPFRGFSRSGATISTGLIRGLPRMACEQFSFFLAVILTPPVIARELKRLLRSHDGAPADLTSIKELLMPGVLGMAMAFVAGVIALKWLSHWLENGKWKYFGYYCLVASAVVFGLSFSY